jgi:hypothetical protein
MRDDDSAQQKGPRMSWDTVHIILNVLMWLGAGGALSVTQGHHADRLERVEESREQMQIDMAVMKKQVADLEAQMKEHLEDDRARSKH